MPKTSEVRVLDQIVTANPEQELYQTQLFGWRWGPAWTADGKGGTWAIHNNGHETDAVRVELRDDVEKVDPIQFRQTLDYYRHGNDRVDDQLRGLSGEATEPIQLPAERSSTVPVPASIEDALAELNLKARAALGGPAVPDGCPDRGEWVRWMDSDGAHRGKWHQVRGWTSPTQYRPGRLRVGCGSPSNLTMALGDVIDWTLLRERNQPTRDACQKCVATRVSR